MDEMDHFISGDVDEEISAQPLVRCCRVANIDLQGERRLQLLGQIASRNDDDEPLYRLGVK